MSGISISVSADEALSALARAVEKTQKPKDLFDEIGKALVVSTQQRFENEAGPDGTPWPASLRARIEGGKTLTDTGFLVGSITHAASNGGVEVGTNTIYAAIHQTGGTIKPVTAEALAFNIGGRTVFAQSVTIPARPFLGLDEDDASTIEALAGAWIGAALGETEGDHVTL